MPLIISYYYILLDYNNKILLGIISKLYCIHGTNTINEITKGKSIVQQKDINWSKRILGKDALTHIKMKIIIDDFKPKLIPYNNPSSKGSENHTSLLLIYSR